MFNLISILTTIPELTNSIIASHAFVFFIAGFDTSSTTMSHALYELALNTSIQDKLREEINDELKKNDGKLSYEGVKNMKYLHNIFNGNVTIAIKYIITKIFILIRKNKMYKQWFHHSFRLEVKLTYS